MRDRARVVLIAVAVLALDQITKLMVITWIPFQARIPLIDDLLALTHVRNTGAAFGLFSGFLKKKPFLEILIALVIMIAQIIILSVSKNISMASCFFVLNTNIIIMETLRLAGV